MYAAVAAGIYPDVLASQKALGSGFAETYTPNPESVAQYATRYAQYQALGKFVESVTTSHSEEPVMEPETPAITTA
jgi:L-ribulokinase